jgi:hypothetical protein
LNWFFNFVFYLSLFLGFLSPAQAKENPVLYAVDYNESAESAEIAWEHMLRKRVNIIIKASCCQAEAHHILWIR